MPDLPQPTDGSSIATGPSREAQQGSTTDNGAPAPSDRTSLTVGPDGPILLHDVHFLNQMAHFNRERVPERNVHAEQQRQAFVETVAGHLLGGVEGDVLDRAFAYWNRVDAECGKKIEEPVRAGGPNDNPGGQPDAALGHASDPVVESQTNAGR